MLVQGWTALGLLKGLRASQTLLINDGQGCADGLSKIP